MVGDHFEYRSCFVVHLPGRQDRMGIGNGLLTVFSFRAYLCLPNYPASLQQLLVTRKFLYLEFYGDGMFSANIMVLPLTVDPNRPRPCQH